MDKPAAQKNSPVPPQGVLARGITILETFSESALRLTLKELAACTGMDKATILRMLTVLRRFGYVHRNENGSYSPGPSLLRLGALYRSTFDLNSRMQPVISELTRQTGRSVAFYVRNGEDRVCLYRQNPRLSVPDYVDIGRRIPLAAGGSASHILLTFGGEETARSADVRANGHVTTHGEREEGFSSIGLPVFDGDGTFLGALIVAVMTAQYSEDMERAAVEMAHRELAVQGFSATPPQLA